MEVGEAAGCGQGQLDHALHCDGVAIQVVEQGAVFVVIRDQPELSPRPVIYTQEKEELKLCMFKVCDLDRREPC